MKCTKHLSVRALSEFPVVLKLEAAVARSAFVSEHVQDTSVSDLFLLSHVQSVSHAVSQSVSQSVSTRVFTSSIGVRVRRY